MRWEYRVLIAALTAFVLAMLVMFGPHAVLWLIFWVGHLMHPDSHPR